MAPLSETSAEILSDEQIDQLLQEAETRLRAKAGQVAPTESDDVITLQDTHAVRTKRKAIPRLQPGSMAKSYIAEKDGVAHVNPGLLSTAAQQKLANGLRSVEKKQKSKKEVGTLSVHRDHIHMRKIHPNLLDAVQHFFLTCPAPYESIKFIIIVTLTTIISLSFVFACRIA